MKSFIPFLLLFLISVKIPVNAEDLPTLPLIDLVVLSDYIAVATLNETNIVGYPDRLNFKITDWLKTDSLYLAEEITLQYFSSYDFTDYLKMSGGKIETPIDRFLLFFSLSEEVEGQYGLTLSGFRAVSENGNFMLPMQLENPGPYRVISLNKDNPKIDTSLNFNSVVAKTKRMIQRTEKVFALNGIADRDERNTAILQWIRDHITELQDDDHFSENSFGFLREKVFLWVWHSGDDAAAWEALLLRQQLYPDFINPIMPIDSDDLPPFGTGEARDFFYEILTSNSYDTTEKAARPIAAYSLSC